MKNNPLLACLLLALSFPAAKASNFTWSNSTTGGNWSVKSNWLTDSTASYPSWGGNYAYLNNVTSGTRTIVIDSTTAGGGCNGLYMTQTTAGALNLLDIQTGYSVSTNTILGAAAGTSEVLVDATTGNVSVNLSSDAVTGTYLTVNSGGVLALLASGANKATYAGSVLVNGGLVTASGSNVIFSGSTVTVTAGTLALNNVVGGVLTGPNFLVNGGVANISGSNVWISSTTTVSSGVLAITSGSGFSFSNGLNLNGGLVQLGAGVSVQGAGLSMSSGTLALTTTPSIYGSFNVTGGVVSGTNVSFSVYALNTVFNPTSISGTIGMTLWGSGTAMSLTTNSYLNYGLTLRSNVASVQKFTLSSSIASSMANVTLLNQWASGSTTVQLGSNVMLGNMQAAGYSIADGVTFTIDAAGYNLAFTGGWTPNNGVNSTAKNTLWNLTNSTGNGGIVATNFNLFNAYSTSVSNNLVLTATGGASSVNTLSGSNGTIAPTSTFRYVGAATAGSPATITSNRAIGRLEVGNGSTASYLKVTGTDLTVGADVKVASNSAFDLGGRNVTETAAIGGTSGGLNGGGTLYNNTSGTTTTITLDTTNGNGSFLGSILDNTTGTGKVALTKNGAGTQVLGGSNGYTGATVVNGGELDVNGSLAAASAVTVNSGATLGGSGTANGTVTVNNANVNGGGLHTGAATFYGQSSLSGSVNASSMTIASGLTTASGVAVCSGSLLVQARATLQNTGTATASIVTVEATAALNNNGLINGPVNVSGLLSGSGTVNGALAIKRGGELSPGNSAGIATVSGSLTVEDGAKISMQISGSGVAGTDYDQIIVKGADSLVNLNTGSILNLTLEVALTDGQALMLIGNESDNAIVGTFSSVVIGSGTYDVSSSNTFTYNGQKYQLEYNVNGDNIGATANDLELLAVPEPGAWAMLLGGLGVLAGYQRMRRRS